MATWCRPSVHIEVTRSWVEALIGSAHQGVLLREIDQYTSPLDELDQESDFRFELPEAGVGEVIIVDDDPSAVAMNTAILEAAGYKVMAFDLPSKALLRIAEGVPAVLVTDFVMPEMSGLELTRKAQEIDPEVKVILLTGGGDESTAQEALRMGVSDYIMKPPEPVALGRSVQRAFHQRAAEDHHRAMVSWMKLELDRRAQEIRRVTVGTLAAFANALDLRSPYFYGHSQAVAMQAAAIADALKLSPDEIEAVRTAGLLHDVGMMAIPDALVAKDSALTEEEFAVIRSHCDRGVTILEPMTHLGDTIRFVHEHHERWDGSGYPDGKKGSEISLGGQIVGIAEAWIAILQSRAYRTGLAREEGLKLLRELRGQWFSADVTDAFQEADTGVM